MTNETRNRIEAYKNALPEMKERVMAGAFLLIMSVMMLTSASFAWITLSRAPEAAGMQTTVAANGNLEIALAQGSTKDPAVAPGESQVGDSSAAENQSIVEANGTWGNLVNVSDPTYGLSNIALRPALLSAYNRTEYPLNGATYGGDGRVVTTNDRYEFASYELVENTTDQYYLAAGDKVNYGVRAISSLGYKNFSGNVATDNYRNNTIQWYGDAQKYYGMIVAESTNEVNTLAPNVTCISALEGLVTVFAQDKINQMGYGPEGDKGTTSKTSCSPYLWYLYQMMLLLDHALELEGKAILEMANWQAYMASGDAKIEKTFESIEEVIAANKEKTKVDGKTVTVLASKGVTLTTLDNYMANVADLEYCINGIKPMAEKCTNPDAPEKDYYWEHIAGYVNKLVDINSTSINGKKLDDIKGATDAVAVLGGGDVIVSKGILKDTELRMVDNTYRVSANVKVVAKTNIPFFTNTTVKGVVYTDAYGKEALYGKDLEISDSVVGTSKGDATAKDTYGLALDVWVRTNYPGAVLTLEGSAKYKDERATITINNETYELYTMTVGEGDTAKTVDVYKKTVDGVEKWYYASTSSEIREEDKGTIKEKNIQVVVGYEGENRVWEDWQTKLESGLIEKDATTQGAGSCFVFYADTPTEQAKIMEMLDAFNVAFMDQEGNILGTAKLNLESSYANQGKVTVPLEVEAGTDYTDETGAVRKGITTLTQNTPTLITAIVYLNGSKLQNENVLAEGELQGQLNIQFGTDSVLVAPDNEELQAQARTIMAEVSVGNTTIKDGIIGGDEGLEYKAEGYNATVNLTVDGEQPERINGFFVRVINDTQGTRGEEQSFTRNEDGTWSANFKLTNPGLYAFNTLIVDGVQYTLHDGTEQSGMNTYYEKNRPFVRIKGLKITSATVGVEPGTHMTAATSMNFPVTVMVDAAVEPKQVNAQFFNTDNTKQYTAILKKEGNQWVGSADIDSSDTYTLKYISVDGVTLEAPTTGSYTLYLGLTARVSTTLAEWEFYYTGPSQITMIARIFDDTGETIKNLSGVELEYNNILSPAPMAWDAEQGYYTGTFEILQPGELTFKQLNLGEAGKIFNISGCPTFWAMSLEKPEYESVDCVSTQTVIKDTLKATMTATLKNAETASVYAVVEHKEFDESTKEYKDASTTYYIPSTGAGNIRTFELPKIDGLWTIKQLLLQNVYDPDYNNGIGKWYAKPASESTEAPTYTTDKPAGEHFELSTEVKSTEVIATYKVTLVYGGVKKDSAFTEKFGGTEANFMAVYNSKDLTVEVCDYRGRAINGIQSVKWNITHDADTMQSYGGYTGTGRGTNTVTLTLKSGSQTVYEAPAQEFRVAGKYTSTIVVDLGDYGTKNLTEVPTFEVRSKAPALTIDSIKPTPNTNYTTLDSEGNNKTVKSSINGNTITIYPEIEKQVTGEGCSQKTTYDFRNEAQVKLKFEGLGNAQKATLTFTTSDNDGTVHLYSGTSGKSGTRTDSYIWENGVSDTITRIVGYYNTDACTSSVNAGTLLSAQEVIMEYDNGETTEKYKVDIDAITIINNAPKS